MPARKKAASTPTGVRGRSRKRKDQLLDELKDQDAQLAGKGQLIDQLRSELDQMDTLIDEKLLLIESRLDELLTGAEPYIPYDPDDDDGDPDLGVDVLAEIEAPKHSRAVRFLAMMAILAVLIAFVVALVSAGTNTTSPYPATPDQHGLGSSGGLGFSEPAISLDKLDQHGMQIGQAGSKHKLSIYADLAGSGFARAYRSVIRPLLIRNARGMTMTPRHHDLQLTLYPMATRQDHEAQWVARAAMVAGAHDQLLQFIDAYLSSHKVAYAAKKAGLKGWRKAARYGKSQAIASNRETAGRLLTGGNGAMVADGQVLSLNAVLPAVTQALS